MYWKQVTRADGRARRLADKHYSRQNPGAFEFCPPGNNIVLVGLNDDALWVSHRPDPKANLVVPRMDGFEYWDKPYFRNESDQQASMLIRQAIAVTLWCWLGSQTDVPRDGFHSFVDPKKVKQTIRRGRPTYGYCFERAGFSLHSEPTKDKKLLRYILTSVQLLNIEPLEPQREQLRLFA